MRTVPWVSDTFLVRALISCIFYASASLYIFVARSGDSFLHFAKVLTHARFLSLQTKRPATSMKSRLTVIDLFSVSRAKHMPVRSYNQSWRTKQTLQISNPRPKRTQRLKENALNIFTKPKGFLNAKESAAAHVCFDLFDGVSGCEVGQCCGRFE